MIQYHDKEWGVPVHDDRTLFEFLVLESAQAGLTWQTVLNKRENYRNAFDAFDPAKIALYNSKDVRRILRDSGIIRNRLKIDAMSKELRGRGFRFVGPTICYAFMQAVGMVNDHTTKCFRYAAV